MDPLLIFLSSPGDVADERELARRLLKDELPYDPFLRGRVAFDVVSWDDPYSPTPTPAQLTPQQAVDRHLPRPSACDVVVVVLWARMGTPLPPEYRKPDGEPYLSGTEWEYEDALRSGRNPQPDVLVYRRTETPRIDLEDPDGPNIQEALDQRRRVNRFFTRFRNPDGSLRGGVAEYKTPSDFVRRLESDLRHLIERRLRRRGAAVAAVLDAVSLTAPVWSGSPYPGLRPFTAEEAPVFFGRGREVDALIDRLRDPAQHFLAVVGASGCGKSSLVRAGLLPRLAAGAIEGSRHWRLLEMRPGDEGGNPFLALAARLKALLPDHLRRPSSEVAEELTKAPQGVLGHVPALLVDRQDSAALALFVDQFEELFAPVAEGHREAFLRLLKHAAGDPRVRVLITLREDFLSRCVSEPDLAPLLQNGVFMLAPPGPAALADMIRKPAERAGLDLEEDVANKTLRDGGGDPGEALPLVAFCLEELYRRTAPKHRLTLDAYRAMGGLQGAIGQRAGELLEEFREVQGVDLDAALSQVFRALVYVDAAGKAARQRASRDVLMAAPTPVPQLVETLIKGRLLLAEDAGGRAVVTLTHEALIQEWPKLREWLECNRARMQRVQRQLLNLRAPEAKDRRHAAEALGEIGSAGPEVVPALIPVLGDANGDVSQAAAVALGGIGPAAAEAVPALAAALGNAERDVSQAAAVALGKIGPAAAEAVPALITALADTDWNVRRAVVEALGQIGPAAAEAVPALITALADVKEYVRRAVVEALGQIGPAAAEAVPALITALADTEEDVRKAAARTLGQIGPAAAEAVPALITALADAKEYVRWAAVALGGIGRAAPEVVVPALITALADAKEDVRRAAAGALGRIGPAAAEAVPVLITALADAKDYVRRAAAYALGQIGPAAAEAVPALITALANAEEDVRWAAAEALVQIGPATA